jgi:hypothetical protein
MDPYLEDPFFFHGFHNNLILRIHDALNEDLPPGYSAYIEQRLAITPVERDIYTDVMVTKTPKIPRQHVTAGVAVAERGLPDAIVGALTPEIFDWYIEIRTARRRLPIVCIIEILSPANKEAGSDGRREYRLRQQEIRHSEAHLMEIDLLRGGMHTVGVSAGTIPRRGDAWDYLICLSRSTDRSRFECWYNSIVNSLPEVRVPLLGETPDIILDLQAAFHRAYVSGPYVNDIDYEEAVTPPIQAEKASWAKARIADWKRAAEQRQQE